MEATVTYTLLISYTASMNILQSNNYYVGEKIIIVGDYLKAAAGFQP